MVLIKTNGYRQGNGKSSIKFAQLLIVAIFVVTTICLLMYLSLIQSILISGSDQSDELLPTLSSDSKGEGHIRGNKEMYALTDQRLGVPKECTPYPGNGSTQPLLLSYDKLCVLWKGISSPGRDKNNDNLSQEKRVHIVVSHCKGELHWLSVFTQNYATVASMHIITKCGQKVIGAPQIATIQELPNRGRCDHSYVKFITSILDGKLSEGEDDDNSIVMFLKDDMSAGNIHQKARWNDFETMVRTASSTNGFACGLVYDKMVYLGSTGFDMSAYYLTDKLLEFTMIKYDRRKDMYQWDGVEFKSIFNNLGFFYREVLNAVPSSKIIQNCNGGVFATTISNIKKVDPSIWKAAEKVLQRGDSIEEGHFMERSWAYLLASPLEQYQINALMKYSYDDRARFDDVYYKSFRGALIHKTDLALRQKEAQRWAITHCAEGAEGENQYMEQYPDVKEKIVSEKSRFKNGFDHYIQSGMIEGRIYKCANEVK
mmetsp:Transcript_3366/g.8572  ORF Transcript_3366/g.8572 Transcript_3366/m.8572 type:complete len:485 (-) Transcript_3366:80-1534(-)